MAISTTAARQAGGCGAGVRTAGGVRRPPYLERHAASGGTCRAGTHGAGWGARRRESGSSRWASAVAGPGPVGLGGS